MALEKEHGDLQILWAVFVNWNCRSSPLHPFSMNQTSFLGFVKNFKQTQDKLKDRKAELVFVNLLSNAHNRNSSRRSKEKRLCILFSEFCSYVLNDNCQLVNYADVIKKLNGNFLLSKEERNLVHFMQNNSELHRFLKLYDRILNSIYFQNVKNNRFTLKEFLQTFRLLGITSILPVREMTKTFVLCAHHRDLVTDKPKMMDNLILKSDENRLKFILSRDKLISLSVGQFILAFTLIAHKGVKAKKFLNWFQNTYAQGISQNKRNRIEQSFVNEICIKLFMLFETISKKTRIPNLATTLHKQNQIVHNILVNIEKRLSITKEKAHLKEQNLLQIYGICDENSQEQEEFFQQDNCIPSSNIASFHNLIAGAKNDVVILAPSNTIVTKKCFVEEEKHLELTLMSIKNTNQPGSCSNTLHNANCLQVGSKFLKFCSRGQSHNRFFWVDECYLCWKKCNPNNIKTSFRQNKKFSLISLKTLEEVQVGRIYSQRRMKIGWLTLKCWDNKKCSKRKFEPVLYSLILKFATRTLILGTRSVSKQQEWSTAFKPFLS